MAKKWVVNEITYPDMNSGLEEQAPKGWKKSGLPKYNDAQKKQMEEVRQNYIDAGYTNKPWDVYFYSPEWVKTSVRYNWEVDSIPSDYQDIVERAKQNRRQTEQQQWLNGGVNNLKETNNWWQTAGSTVPQNTQNTTQNQNGTSVSNGNANTRKYDWTDGNGNITVWPQNANLNYYQYWDDSNPNQQWQKGWMNAKYTGEWVSNSYIEYNPDITLADLDPNYLYWENARQQNRKEAWYIARRNDMIASALYNEWKVSKEEVAEFLSQQNERMNSTEADRLNTIESVWKRLWQIKPEEKIEEEPQTDFNKDTSGKIYGKTTAEEWNPKQWIDTLEDDNSVFKSMQESRVRTADEMYNLWVDNLAATKYYNTWAYSEQNWRDFSLRYPETAALVEQKVKEMKTQENVTAISNWWDIVTAADNVNTDVEATSYSVNNSTSTSSATQLLKSIDSILSSNDTAKSAQDLMGSIEKDMATLKNRLKNLRAEANSKFKWDVPDYLVNAYMNNKTQEIQNQLSILEDRYNAAYNRYKTELSHAERQAEYDLKKDSLTLEEWKAKNISITSSSNWTWNAKMRTERNNNPTAMTTDVAKMLWWELGVDYEIWDPFTTASWQTLYTAKLIGDPIETTIRLIDRWIANGIDPFYRSNWQWRWSYISKIWVTKDKWLKMTDAEKADVIAQMLKHEWGSMENMLYYVNQEQITSSSFNEAYAPVYEKYLSWDYSKAWLEAQTKAMWINERTLDAQARAWKEAEDKKMEENLKNKPAKWKRKDWTEFDMSDTPTFDTLTYDQQNIVYQLLNLNKNPATVTKRQYWDDFEKILSAVKEINPSWSDSDYWQADKVKKEWNTSSKNGSNSRNGTAIATAKDIYEIADNFWNERWKDWNGMLNKLRDELSDEKYTELLINLEVLASEYAWALKGNNAAPTEQEIADKKEIIAANLWAWAMKQAAKDIAKTLYNKNANEADNYYNATLTKPPLVVTKDVADWMYNVVWIKDLPNKYQYTAPKWSEWNKRVLPDIDVSQYVWKSIWDALTGSVN